MAAVAGFWAFRFHGKLQEALEAIRGRPISHEAAARLHVALGTLQTWRDTLVVVALVLAGLAGSGRLRWPGRR